jgi:hypothetical protein
MYFVKRHQIWWAFHDLPADPQPPLGRRVARSPSTPNRAETERLASILWLDVKTGKLFPMCGHWSFDSYDKCIVNGGPRMLATCPSV